MTDAVPPAVKGIPKSADPCAWKLYMKQNYKTDAPRRASLQKAGMPLFLVEDLYIKKKEIRKCIYLQMGEDYSEVLNCI